MLDDGYNAQLSMGMSTIYQLVVGGLWVCLCLWMYIWVWWAADKWCGCVTETEREEMCHLHFEDIKDTCMLEEFVGSGGLAYFNFSFLMIGYWLLDVCKIVCILHFLGPLERKFSAMKLA